VIDDLIDELDETLTWIQGSDYEHCLVRHIERAASLFTVLFCLEYEPDDSARLRAAKLERLIVARFSKTAYRGIPRPPALSVHGAQGKLYAEADRIDRRIVAEAARIAKRRAGK